MQKQETQGSTLNNGARLSKSDKVKIDFIKTMDMLTECLQEAFQVFFPIPEVLMVFGATLMSPIEVYRLRLPTQVLDAKILSERDCLSVLLRNLIGSDMFENVKEAKTINKWTVLVLAPRQSDFGDKLSPRLTFKPPTRGTQFLVDFKCKGKVVDPDISESDDFLEVSGIEPLELSISNDTDTMETDSPVIERDSEDLIWYELKPSIKGFRI